MKIWIKLIIAGIIIFFAGVFYGASQGEGMVLRSGFIPMTIGFVLILLGGSVGIERGVRRMKNE